MAFFYVIYGNTWVLDTTLRRVSRVVDLFIYVLYLPTTLYFTSPAHGRKMLKSSENVAHSYRVVILLEEMTDRQAG